ncbi:hypothetical protein CsSME_00002612 [Camellia sinensis var. sinensis]
MMITDLHYDLEKIIMLFVVKSLERGAHLVRAISVVPFVLTTFYCCNGDFAKFANDEDVLRAANFDNVGLLTRYESYQCIHGLINKCAQVGNIILVTSSQYLIGLASISLVTEKDTTASVMAYFMVDQASTSKRSGGSVTHAKLTLLLCGLVDFVTMRPHLDNYFKYFLGSISGPPNFFYSINGMSTVVHLSKKGKIWYPCQKLKGIYVESGEGKRELNALCILMEIDFNREVFHKTYAPSGLNLKELERECKDIVEQLILVTLGKRKNEANTRYINLGERVFFFFFFFFFFTIL